MNPKLIRNDSKMPQHRFLFEVAEKGDGDELIAVIEGDEEVYYKPTKDAEALVEYLLSLKSANYPLEEAPVYQPFTSSLPKPTTPTEEVVESEDVGASSAN